MCLDEEDKKELEKKGNENSLILYAYKKVILSIFSVKLWAYFLCFFFCCGMLYIDKMTAEVFSNTIISMFGLTFAFREYSKTQFDKKE